ncbi:hypothetical protein GCM10007112_04680 [Vulcanisaeta souniana JCM 11219]|uniref:Uncharacterized protein n=1 Tax=Vulcanisaeta souniana JCM 11219 TaxID=1293586 RepID=A0A830E4P5_9CREN|nr:hypothetical protein GCM10007112_04680 [Vulcanisaeta souniana JCM 11219]
MDNMNKRKHGSFKPALCDDAVNIYYVHKGQSQHGTVPKIPISSKNKPLCEALIMIIRRIQLKR